MLPFIVPVAFPTEVAAEEVMLGAVEVVAIAAEEADQSPAPVALRANTL